VTQSFTLSHQNSGLWVSFLFPYNWENACFWCFTCAGFALGLESSEQGKKFNTVEAGYYS